MLTGLAIPTQHLTDLNITYVIITYVGQPENHQLRFPSLPRVWQNHAMTSPFGAHATTLWRPVEALF